MPQSRSLGRRTRDQPTWHPARPPPCQRRPRRLVGTLRTTRLTELHGIRTVNPRDKLQNEDHLGYDPHTGNTTHPP